MLFKYKFSTKIKRPISQNGYAKEIQIVKNYIDEKKGIIVLNNNRELAFKGTFSNWRPNIFSGVESGKFSITKERGMLKLIYQIKIDPALVYLTILGIALTCIFYQVWVVGMPFIGLGGINWLIALVRNNAMMYNIAFEIDQLDKQKMDK